MSSTTQGVGRVTLVDPNDQIAVSKTTPNGTPPLELMRPHVELHVYRRRGGVIRVDGNGRYFTEGGESTLRVNLLNYDTATQQFTEKYLDDVVGRNSRTSNEGFGIRSVSVKLNQNYVPEVTITFLDLHGGSLFRLGDAGPLGVLYDYPAPLFKLRLKGAFGKYVEYDLHPTRENNRLGGGISNTPEITMSFIGQYYGPMTDVLLGYLKAVPYLNGKGIVGAGALASDSGAPLTSFYDLVLRGKLLYTAVDNFKEESTTVEQSQTYTRLGEEVRNLENRMAGVLAPASVEGQLREELRGRHFPDTAGVLKVNPEGVATPADTLVLQLPPGRRAAMDSKGGEGETGRVMLRAAEKILLDPLRAEFSELGAGTSEKILLDFTPGKGLVTRQSREAPEGPYELVYGFAGLRRRLNELKSKIGQQGQAARGMVQEQLQGLTQTVLGEKPTIGTITKLVMDDADYLLRRIKEAGDTAKPGEARESEGAKAIGKLAWPVVYRDEPLNSRQGGGQTQPALQYPGAFSAFQQWPEVQLVEEYCRALTRAERDLIRTENVQQVLSTDTFVPISSLENLQLSDVEVRNPYVGTDSVYALLRVMMERYLFCQDYAYALLFHTQPNVTTTIGNSADAQDGQVYNNLRGSVWAESTLLSQNQREELIDRLAKVEARNAAYALRSNETLSKALQQLGGERAEALLARVQRDLSEDRAIGSVLRTLLGGVGTHATELPFRSGPPVYYRGAANTNFSGLVTIVENDTPRGKSLRTPKQTTPTTLAGSSTPLADPLDEETTAFLRGLGQTMFGSGDDAIVTEANVLLYPDTAAGYGSGETAPAKSDFLFSEGQELTTYFISKVLEPAFNSAGFEQAGAERIYALMAYLETSGGKVHHLYSGNGKGNFFEPEMVRRFLLPGVLEVPFWYACYLAYLSRGRAYDVRTYRYTTAWETSQAPVASADGAKLRTLAEAFDITPLVTAYKEIVHAENGVTSRVAAKLRQHPAWLAFLAPVYLVNASSQTFLRQEDNEQQPRGFRSLAVGAGKVRTPFKRYAEGFARELRNQLKTLGQEQNQRQKQTLDQLGDIDFKTDIYYGFKALYDRWLAGNDRPLDPLFNSFRFLTRSYQDISQECVVDFQCLLDDASSPENAVFTAMSRLLSGNNFLFFPLHTYLDFGSLTEAGKALWGGDFSIADHLGSDTIAKPAFVCMYVGGYSSQLDNPENTDYPDDGFTFGIDQPIDFSEPGGPVVAFRVRSGLQNQSVFGYISIDSAEFKNTDVSLRLQDDIIKQQADAIKIRKAQNLLNVYAQRSYVCSVPVPMGNMCLQPTQYFQLEGVNLYGGAYMIHEVTHDITAENQQLATNFKGYRMGRHVFRVISDPLLDYVGARGTGGSDYSQLDQRGLALPVSTDPRRITEAGLRALCQEYGYPLNMIKAFIKVESGRESFDPVTGKITVRFEPKQFYKRTKQLVGATVEDGRIRETCHTSQATEYAAFEQASALNRGAALESCSWGAMQVMGFNYRSLHYPGVEEMVKAFSASEAAQIRGALDYIRSRKPLEKAVRGLDFRNTAYYYNGSDYYKGNYDTKLRKAYELYASQLSPTPAQTLQLRREERLSDRTLGILSHEGQFVAHILEDTVRPKGQFVQGVTAIEPGIYQVELTYSPRLKRETPVLKGVPHHNDGLIRIHRGESPSDSLGCLLTGLEKAGGQLDKSGEAEELVTAKVRGMLRSGPVYINVT